MSDRKIRLQHLKQNLLNSVNKKLVTSKKTSKLTLDSIYSIYKNKIIDLNKIEPPATSNKKTIYCRLLKDTFKEYEAIKDYLEYCINNWEELRLNYFTRVDSDVPPLAFISSQSVVCYIADIRKGKTKKQNKPKVVIRTLSNRGKYDGSITGDWLNDVNEIRVYKEAVAKGIQLTNREEFDKYIKGLKND